MELKRDNVALLDKICVYNFQISKVENYDYLLEAGIIIVKEKQKNYIEIAGPGQYISSIRIKKTKYFDSFLYEVGKDGHPYGRMEMSVDDAVYHNLNCFTTIEYVEKLKETSVYKGYKQDKIEMRGDRAEMSDFPLYLNTVAGGLDCRDQTIGGFSFVVKIYALPVVEIIG